MYIQRKISKLKSKVILPPTPKEILEDDVNYPDYVQKALNFEIDFDEVKKLYNNLTPSTHPNQNIQKLYQEFEKQIIEIFIILAFIFISCISCILFIFIKSKIMSRHFKR